MSGDSLLIPWYTLALPLTPRYTPKILSYSCYFLLLFATHLLHPDASCYSLLQPCFTLICPMIPWDNPTTPIFALLQPFLTVLRS